MITERKVKWWYTRINNSAFGGKLPPLGKFEIISKNDRSLGVSWTRDWIEVGKPDKIVFVDACIGIHKNMLWAKNLFLMVLVHEMVHIAHPTWKRCSARNFENEVLRVKRKTLPRWVLH